ncbi:MAG: 50S ribosomal protein L4 [Rhodothermales bacterium]|nr:50S ribosomal protein L4 [Rhodothermales bacterium]
MKVKVYSKDGKATRRSVTLDPEVFGIEPNDHAIWLDVRRVQANGRQGTHKTKERNETAGSGRKLYRQKGTGHARAGDAKSPIRRSGGRTFGPSPRSYSLKINKKTQRLARKSALSYKAKDDKIRVIDSLSFDEPSTSALTEVIDALDLGGSKLLILTNGVQSALVRSGSNLRKLCVREAASASTVDLLDAGVILIEEAAIDALATVLGGKSEETVTA